MPLVSLDEWKQFIASRPEYHLLQTGEWGELKAGFGWRPYRFIGKGDGVQILVRSLPLGYTLAYVPKSNLNRSSDLWEDVFSFCQNHRVVFLKVEPDGFLADSQGLEEPWNGFFQSPHSIQPRRTVVIDLRGSDDEILLRMKQKCRYNIRLAEKKSIEIHPWADISGFHAMMIKTGDRDGFGVHSEAYYARAYGLFHSTNMTELLVAEYAGKPLAALMVSVRGKRAWYLYGASSDEERNRMPTYLLQWEAMKWAKASGAESYDLWGIPDEDETTLETQFESRTDGLWGVYRFKRGFGGKVVRASQAMDRVFHPWIYKIYLRRMAGREAG